MRFYHSTTSERAEQIVREGFRDATGRYLTDQEFSGVWLSDFALYCSEGASMGALLAVDMELTQKQLEFYEWVEEGRSYREWLVPAKLINEQAVVTMIDRDDVPSRFGPQEKDYG